MKIKISILACVLILMPLHSPVKALAENVIVNPSVEIAGLSQGQPQGWQMGGWGSNQATYEYTASGAQEGTRSLHVQVSSYTGGDAKWIFTPVSVTPGISYVYSDYYISTVNTEVVAEVSRIDNSKIYFSLGAVPPSSNWNKAIFNFAMPSDVQKVSVFHLIKSIGSLQTDNFSLTPLVAPTLALSNTVPNSSLEQASADTASRPTAWNNDKWGQNTATFSYLSTGYTGNRSVKTEVTSYTSGDAKWRFDSQPISAGQNYQVSDYYQANTLTRVVLAMGTNTGTTLYRSLPDATPTSGWSKYSASFVAPSNAVNVTILHLVSSVGYLVTDDYSLTPTSTLTPTPSPTPNPTIQNGVPNSSVEQISTTDSALPLDWGHDTWGTNTAIFSYLSTGHTGNRSLKTQITSYASGDAKWYYKAQPATPGQYYEVSTYYQSDVSTQVIIEMVMSNGSTQYYTLKQAPIASSWTKYVDAFVAPDGAISMRILHLIARVGFLTTDDYSLVAKQPGVFNRALLSFTFDDGWQSIFSSGLPLLNKYQVPSTQYIISGYLGAPFYMTTPQIREFKNSGHQIGAHTIDHSDLTTLSSANLTMQLSQSKATLEAIFGPPVQDFASPYGAYNATVINAIKNYYRSHRSTDVGYNTKDLFDVYNIKVQNIEITTSPAQVQIWINRALADKTWLVLVYHQVDTSGNTYSVTPANLEAELQAARSSGIATVTVDQAINEITPQLK